MSKRLSLLALLFLFVLSVGFPSTPTQAVSSTANESMGKFFYMYYVVIERCGQQSKRSQKYVSDVIRYCPDDITPEKIRGICESEVALEAKADCEGSHEIVGGYQYGFTDQESASRAQQKEMEQGKDRYDIHQHHCSNASSMYTSKCK